MTFAKPAVSFLGLGEMGSALAATVLRAGHPTTVWNRNAAFPKADEHCRKFGKVAKPTNSAGEYAFTFECVKAGT